MCVGMCVGMGKAKLSHHIQVCHIGRALYLHRLFPCRLFFVRCKISLNFKQHKLGWRPGNEADTVYHGRWNIWEGPLTSLNNMVSTRPVDRQRNQPLASRNDRHPLPFGEAH